MIPGLSNPQAWNKYSYTLNNPIKYIDPSGHEPITLLIITILSLVTIAASAHAVEAAFVEQQASLQDSAALAQEQAAAAQYDYLNSCARCHYSMNVDMSQQGNSGNRPVTPLGDQYNHATTNIVVNSAGVVGDLAGIYALGKPTLLNVEARKWYLKQEDEIPAWLNSGLPLKGQAQQAFELRNLARTQARNLMLDQELAQKFNLEAPNLTWEQVIQKGIDKGNTGDDIYRCIINSSQRSRQSVNRALGIYRPQ